MTDEIITGQIEMQGLDSLFGRTSQEHSAQTTEQTSKPSSRKSSESSTPTLPTCLCLKSGQNQDVYTTSWEDGQLLGVYTTHSFGESPNEESVSLLSQILEVSPDPKYSLSAKACDGILRRADRRGKELPPMLRGALEMQIEREKNYEASLSRSEEVVSLTVMANEPEKVL